MKSIAHIPHNLPRQPLPGAPPDEESVFQLCRPDCLLCAGSGWLRQDLKPGQPDFGKMLLCPNVSLERLPYAERYGLTADERGLNWEHVLDLDNVLQAVEALRKTLEQGYGWVYLWGSYGTAKSLLLKASVAQALRQNSPAAYTRMAEILDHLRSAYNTTDPSWESERRLEWWAGLPVLAIDELDRIRQTDYALERQFLLLDRRYQQALHRQSVTLIAANSDPANQDGYLFDRIRDGRFAIVHLTGDSARPGMDETMPF